jgi:dTDP-4-amino-4,6-dideoxy-D-galactose acyltransferase
MGSGSPIPIDMNGDYPNEVHGIMTLSWDSEHFGFPVGHLVHPDLTDEQLESTLLAATNAGFKLLYWFTSSDRNLSSILLTRFNGLFVNQRASFERKVEKPSLVVESLEKPGLKIHSYPIRAAANELLDLGLLAGQNSRFLRDHRISRPHAEELFRIWTNRSTKRELADIVFVAEMDERIVGFITAKQSLQTGKIGLIASDPRIRDQGIGTCLLGRVHHWMEERAIIESHVSTQLDNVAACQLYRKAGYHLAKIESVYHFWPSG